MPDDNKNDLSNPFNIGAIIAGFLIAVLMALRAPLTRVLRRIRQVNRIQPTDNPRPNLPACTSALTNDERLNCYKAWVRGQKNRLISHLILQLLGSPPAKDAGTIIRKVKVHMNSHEIRDEAIRSTLTLMRKSGLITENAGTHTFQWLPEGETLFNDYESWRRHSRLSSNQADQLKCFDCIVKYVTKTNTMRFVLEALKHTNRPLKAHEILDIASRLIQAEQSNIAPPTPERIQKHLDDLQTDPFVEENDGEYQIHSNGLILMHCVAADLC